MKQIDVKSSGNTLNIFCKPLLLLCMFWLPLISLAQNTGIFQTYAIIDRGNGNEYYAGGINAAGSTSFLNLNLGSFYPDQTLLLNGGEVKTWKNEGGDVFGANIYYRVYPLGTDANLFGFNQVDLPFNEELGGGDQKWARFAHNVNLLSGRTAGNWVLEVYWDSPTNQGTNFDSRFGENFQAFFTVLAPAAAGPVQGPSSSCAVDTELAFSVAPVAGATGYVWSLPSGFSISSGSGTSSIMVNMSSAAQSGQISVYATNAAGNGSSSAKSFTVFSLPAAPVITASGPLAFCAGGSVELFSDQASGNLWSTQETGASIVVSSSGEYGVTYTDGNGCSAESDPVSVTVYANPAAPVITASGPLAFCAGGSVELFSDQASGNLWSTQETGASIVVSSSGEYRVTYTDGNGCSAESDPVSVTVYANPAAPVITASGPLAFCAGGSVELFSDQTSGNLWSTQATGASIVVSSSR
jgi:hypothetical protein